jgi:hypothetical protein
MDLKEFAWNAVKAAVTAAVAYVAANWANVGLPDDVKAIVAVLAVALWNRFAGRLFGQQNQQD